MYSLREESHQDGLFRPRLLKTRYLMELAGSFPNLRRNTASKPINR
jgi:hypothetical protein